MKNRVCIFSLLVRHIRQRGHNRPLYRGISSLFGFWPKPLPLLQQCPGPFQRTGFEIARLEVWCFHSEKEDSNLHNYKLYHLWVSGNRTRIAANLLYPWTPKTSHPALVHVLCRASHAGSAYGTLDQKARTLSIREAVFTSVLIFVQQKTAGRIKGFETCVIFTTQAVCKMKRPQRVFEFPLRPLNCRRCNFIRV